jgi:hypothetical protein
MTLTGESQMELDDRLGVTAAGFGPFVRYIVSVLTRCDAAH